MSKKIETPETLSLETALYAVASHFVEIVEKQDGSTGELVKVNQLAFTQRRVINGFCYTLELQLKSTNTSIDKAAGELRGLMRSNRGDEISLKNVDSKRAFIERLIDQQAVIEDALRTAKGVHLDVTGDAYEDVDTQRARRAKDDEAAQASPLPQLSEAAKLLASLGKRESAHPALSMDRLDRSNRVA